MMYGDGLGVPANSDKAFLLLMKAADAGVVQAMAPLSYLYAAMRTATSRYRANYWSQMAADKGDPQGWVAVGDEYKQGLLGGEPPSWYSQAMYSYEKAAVAGSCVAMLEIGSMYRDGQGVARDPGQAQSWLAKAQACSGSDLQSLQKKANEYRDKAVAGAGPLFGDLKNFGSNIGASQGAGLSPGQKLLAAAVAGMALA
jgi:hypothetical protein